MKRTRFMPFLLPLLLCACQATGENLPDAKKTVADGDSPPPTSAPGPIPAEYALRWTTSSTTAEAVTKELQAVLDQLKQRIGSPGTPKHEEFMVTYYDVAAESLPEGYNASLRKRQKIGSENYEVNYKVRGPAPLPMDFPAVKTCERAAAKQEPETDIAVASQHTGNRQNASINCEAKSKGGIPAALTPAGPARLCKIAMTRHTLQWNGAPPSEKKELKVEYWTFKPPAEDKPVHALIEVSWKSDSANDTAEQAFRDAIAPLVTASADRLQPTPPPGKEQTALSCDRNWSP